VPTLEEIADWMAAEVLRTGYVEQEAMAFRIKGKFGSEFVPINDNGNLSVRKDVLKAFRKKSEKTVVWSGSEKAWRKRHNSDAPGRKQD